MAGGYLARGRLPGGRRPGAHRSPRKPHPGRGGRCAWHPGSCRSFPRIPARAAVEMVTTLAEALATSACASGRRPVSAGRDPAGRSPHGRDERLSPGDRRRGPGCRGRPSSERTGSRRRKRSSPAWKTGASFTSSATCRRTRPRTAAGLFRCVQSLDSVHTAQALEPALLRDRPAHGRAAGAEHQRRVSPSPASPAATSCWSGLDAIEKLPLLRVRGLMTVGPMTDDPGRSARRSRSCGRLFQELRGRAGRHSTRFPWACLQISRLPSRKGPPLVRLGTALFGPRVPR